MIRWVLFLTLFGGVFNLNLPGLQIDFDTADDHILAALTDDIAEHYAEEYIGFVKTGKESLLLKQISHQMSLAHTKKDIFTENIDELGVADKFVTCTTCKAFVNVLIKTFLDEDGELHGENREEDSKKAMLAVCKRFNLQTEEVCSGLFDMNFSILNYILENSKADARSLCGTLPISFCKVEKEEWNFSLKIDSGRDLLEAPKSEKPVRTENNMIVLQLTDIHYDPEYKVGSLAECDEPLCCNREAKNGDDSSKLAGFWSDYRNCDAPKHMIENAFEQIRASHDKIDVIYQTGDYVPHKVWNTTKEGNVQTITEMDKLISEKFPGVPVYSCVGNHEPHPTNVFGPSDLPEGMNAKWLYDHMWTLWKKWLPKEAKETVLKGGYYTALHKPGFRIISLNNMDCYLHNWWIYHDGSFAIEQLQWLHDVLLEAEKNNEFVHILAHIPTADADCWSVWSREYNRVIERFSHIISGIFNGHTHKDEMNVHYSQKGHAMMVAWNAGSLTPFANKNPNYRLYEVETKHWQVFDHRTFIFNLTEANLQGEAQKPRWFKEYQFSEAFTDDLSPAGIDALLIEMANKPNLLRKFWEFKVTSADPKLKAGCDNKCLMKTICRLGKSVYNENSRCHELQAILEENLDKEETSTDVPTTTTDPGDDGASSHSLSISIIIGVFLLYKYVF